MRLKLALAALMSFVATNSFASDCGKTIFDAAVNQTVETDDVYADSCVKYSQSDYASGSFYQYYIVISCQKEMGSEIVAYDVRVNADCTQALPDPHIFKEDN